MYTIKQLAKLANISTRTLRYYDQIGLLSPAEYSDAGYRLYDQPQINQLQQVLLFREMRMSLAQIKRILHNPDFDLISSLQSQRDFLHNEQSRLIQLLDTIDTTIETLKGGHAMKPKNQFQGLKDNTVSNNEDTYGAELRNKYGDDVINQSNIKMRNMSKWQWNRAKDLGDDILITLPIAMTKGVRSDDAMELCKMHQEWIQLYWEDYSKEAHLGLCKMYTEDERFTAYYDKVASGGTAFLLQAMTIYLGQ